MSSVLSDLLNEPRNLHSRERNFFNRICYDLKLASVRQKTLSKYLSQKPIETVLCLSWMTTTSIGRFRAKRWYCRPRLRVGYSQGFVAPSYREAEELSWANSCRGGVVVRPRTIGAGPKSILPITQTLE